MIDRCDEYSMLSHLGELDERMDRSETSLLYHKQAAEDARLATIRVFEDMGKTIEALNVRVQELTDRLADLEISTVRDIGSCSVANAKIGRKIRNLELKGNRRAKDLEQASDSMILRMRTVEDRLTAIEEGGSNE